MNEPKPIARTIKFRRYIPMTERLEQEGERLRDELTGVPPYMSGAHYTPNELLKLTLPLLAIERFAAPRRPLTRRERIARWISDRRVRLGELIAGRRFEDY